MPGTTMAVIDGQKWFYWRARHCDEYGGAPVLLMMRWFLQDCHGWIGDFGTKKEMLAWIDSDGAQWLADYSGQPAASALS